MYCVGAMLDISLMSACETILTNSSTVSQASGDENTIRALLENFWGNLDEFAIVIQAISAAIVAFFAWQANALSRRVLVSSAIPEINRIYQSKQNAEQNKQELAGLASALFPKDRKARKMLYRYAGIIGMNVSEADAERLDS